MKNRAHVFSFIVSLLFLYSSYAQWNFLTVPSVHFYSQVDFVSADTGYVAAEFYWLLKTTDGGNTWQTAYNTPGLRSYFYDLEFFDADHGLAIENVFYNFDEPYVERILRTADGGDTWTADTSFNSDRVVDISIANNTTAFFCLSSLDSNKIAKTIDGGETWTIVSSGYDGIMWNMDMVDENKGYIMATHHSDGQLLKTANGWNTMETIDIPEWEGLPYAIHFPSNNVGYITGDNGSIFKTSDGGYSWVDISFQETGITYLDVYFTSETEGYVVGGDSENIFIFKTSDGGATWGSQAPYSSQNTGIINIDFPTPSVGYAVGGSNVYKTTNGGGPVGLMEYQFQHHVNIYPNPTQGEVFIDPMATRVTEIGIYNSMGQQLKTVSFSSKIDLSGFPKGIYLLKIKTTRGLITRKVIKE